MRDFLAHCDQHGQYTATRLSGDRTTGCPACREESYARLDEERAKRDAVKARRYHVERRLTDAGIPRKFRAARMSQLAAPFDPDIGEFVLAAAHGRSTGPLILAGGVGVGKSHAAAAAIRLWIARTKNHSNARFVNQADYCAAVRKCWRRDSERSEDDVLTDYATVPFLVLDDLGAGKAADLELIQTLICRRYDDDLMRSTVVSTNVAPIDFNQAFGQRIADRLREGAVLVTATGPSRRRPAP